MILIAYSSTHYLYVDIKRIAIMTTYAITINKLKPLHAEILNVISCNLVVVMIEWLDCREQIGYAVHLESRIAMYLLRSSHKVSQKVG